MAATRNSGAQSTVAAPQISNEELLGFFESHFSQHATAHFESNFMNPAAASQTYAGGEYDEWLEEDDGLGFYEDGVKRTLTDEQIEIFRHSELEALRKEQEKGVKRKSTSPHSIDDVIGDGDEEDTTPSNTKGKSGKKKKKAAKRAKPEPKPDLRKRTWDIVEAGLDTLDYD